METTLTNQNSIQEENKCRLKSHNACYHSVQNTIYKTAHLKVFTDYWMYPVSLFASIFPYAKHKSTYTYTCCLCEVHSVLKENKSPVQATLSLQCAHVHSYCFIAQQFSCQCAASLTVHKHIKGYDPSYIIAAKVIDGLVSKHIYQIHTNS